MWGSVGIAMWLACTGVWGPGELVVPQDIGPRTSKQECVEVLSGISPSDDMLVGNAKVDWVDLAAKGFRLHGTARRIRNGARLSDAVTGDSVWLTAEPDVARARENVCGHLGSVNVIARPSPPLWYVKDFAGSTCYWRFNGSPMVASVWVSCIHPNLTATGKVQNDRLEWWFEFLERSWGSAVPIEPVGAFGYLMDECDYEVIGASPPEERGRFRNDGTCESYDRYLSQHPKVRILSPACGTAFDASVRSVVVAGETSRYYDQCEAAIGARPTPIELHPTGDGRWTFEQAIPVHDGRNTFWFYGYLEPRTCRTCPSFALPFQFWVGPKPVSSP